MELIGHVGIDDWMLELADGTGGIRSKLDDEVVLVRPYGWMLEQVEFSLEV